MAKWRVEIEVQSDDLEFISNQPLGRVVMNKDAGHYYITSNDWDGLTNSSEVLAQAEDSLRTVNELANLFPAAMVPVGCGQVSSLSDNGRWANHGSKDVGTRFGMREPVSQSTRALFEKCLRLVVQCGPVRDAFRFNSYSRSDTAKAWFDLYKVYEIIRCDVGGPEALQQKKWVLEGQLKRFTQMANNPRALGDAVRHATPKSKVPSEPMSLNEARQMMESLLRAWLQSKV